MPAALTPGVAMVLGRNLVGAVRPRLRFRRYAEAIGELGDFGDGRPSSPAVCTPRCSHPSRPSLSGSSKTVWAKAVPISRAYDVRGYRPCLAAGRGEIVEHFPGISLSISFEGKCTANPSLAGRQHRLRRSTLANCWTRSAQRV
jgi:hypothetical protein